MITDVVILASAKHEDINEDYKARQNRDSQILLFSNAAFLVEFIINLVAFEFKIFFKTRLNVIDSVLCIFFTSLFLIDLLTYHGNHGEFSLEYDALYWTNKFAFFSALRLLWLIMVARASRSLRVLLECVAFTFYAFGNFLVLLLIFLYVYSLLGMQLFAGRLQFDQNGEKITQITDGQLENAKVPRSNFDNI